MYMVIPSEAISGIPWGVFMIVPGAVDPRLGAAFMITKSAVGPSNTVPVISYTERQLTMINPGGHTTSPAIASPGSGETRAVLVMINWSGRPISDHMRVLVLAR